MIISSGWTAWNSQEIQRDSHFSPAGPSQLLKISAPDIPARNSSLTKSSGASPGPALEQSLAYRAQEKKIGGKSVENKNSTTPSFVTRRLVWPTRH
ncbi:hypothetical protein RRG08_030891 [Elysia crispata]|uniref:Uncharacterized protein n=1 Tax=Elysia crispata TaxID=231223 RepID=A0AAE0XSX6_9GAST|nr:hypothetical protein RRG08_030891 [Elysia crispata]